MPNDTMKTAAESPARVSCVRANLGPNFERASSLLRYDPETGHIQWKVRRGSSAAGRITGTKATNGYLQVMLDGRHYMAHRLAWLLFYGRWPTLELDHINRVRTDNRIANLREVTRHQNMMNAGLYSTNKSGIRGVFYHNAARRWVAQIKRHGVQTYLGSYNTMEKAAAAHAAAIAAEALYVGNTLTLDPPCRAVGLDDP